MLPVITVPWQAVAMGLGFGYTWENVQITSAIDATLPRRVNATTLSIAFKAPMQGQD